LLDPEFNIRYAAQNLGGASGNFRAWGEGTEIYDYPYDPKTGKGKFGALGYHPFPGEGRTAAGEATRMPTSEGFTSWLSDIGKVYPRWRELFTKYRMLDQLQKMDMLAIDQSGNFIDAVSQKVVMTRAEWEEFLTLDTQLSDLEKQYEDKYGKDALTDWINRAIALYEYDPRVIEAKWAADEFNRQMDIRTQALNEAAKEYSAQVERIEQAKATAGRGFLTKGAEGGQRIPAGVGFSVAPPPKIRSFEEIFNEQIEKVKAGMPEVPKPPGLDLTGAPPGLSYYDIINSLGKVAETATEPTPPAETVPGSSTRKPLPKNWLERVKGGKISIPTVPPLPTGTIIRSQAGMPGIPPVIGAMNVPRPAVGSASVPTPTPATTLRPTQTVPPYGPEQPLSEQIAYRLRGSRGYVSGLIRQLFVGR
jgi:hypothetical protein